MSNQKSASRFSSFSFAPPSTFCGVAKDFYTLEELCDWYFDPVNKQCMKKARLIEDAEDLRQCIFLRIVRYYHTFDHKRIASCLSNSAQYAAEDWLRAWYREKEHDFIECVDDEDFESLVSESATISKYSSSCSSDPLETIIVYSANDCVEDVLDNDVKKKIDAVLFREIYYNNLSHKEVAEKYNMVLDTVYRKVRRVKEKLDVCS